MKLTEPQRKALEYLATVDYAAPASIGQAMINDSYRQQGASAQGLGRIGGAMAHRLMARGLVRSRHRDFDGFPRYSITSAGREALSN